MGPYKRGQPVNLVERFYYIDPLTFTKTLTDPTTVVFTIDQPDGTTQTLQWNIDSQVTRPSVGVFVCAMGVPPAPGIYEWECVGTGALEATSGVKTFEVLDSDVLPPPSESEFTLYGPCTSWADGADVKNCCSSAADTDSWELDAWGAVASQILFEISGRQFAGVCERTVRPCRQMCNCFGGPTDSLSAHPWFWGSLMPSGAFYWRNEVGQQCGCGSESIVRLAGYPVREIVSVTIDGVALDPSGYRLDHRRDLVRLWDPGPPATQQLWPVCQNLSLDDDEPGTFSVTYKWGTPPPEIGKLAAAALACELWNGCGGGTGECKLPNRVTKVVRSGVTMDKIVTSATLLRTGGTGIGPIDIFIASIGGYGARRRPAVWSPDVQKYAKKLGP